MTSPLRHSPDSPNAETSLSTPAADQPDTVATPEGDNEFAPGQPLQPVAGGHQKVPAIDTNRV